MAVSTALNRCGWSRTSHLVEGVADLVAQTLHGRGSGDRDERSDQAIADTPEED